LPSTNATLVSAISKATKDEAPAATCTLSKSTSWLRGRVVGFVRVTDTGEK